MAKTENRISGITVRGFKSICTEQTLLIRPLTILAGANSSGKSSFMQPLLLLKQTLEASGDPGALRLDGDNVRFTMAEQVLSHVLGQGSSQEFAVRIGLLNDSSVELVFQREERKGFELSKMVYRAGKEVAAVTPSMTHDEILKVLPSPLKTMHKDFSKGESKSLQWKVRQDRCFFVFELGTPDESRQRIRFGLPSVSPSGMFVPFLQGVIHLPGLRGNPQRTYPKTAGGPDFPGTFEQYVASVIAQWQGNGGKQQLDDLALALEDMGLTWKVRAKPVDDTQVELKVGRLPHGKHGGAHDLVSIADVGFGVSQSLPVVVALIVARPGQLVYLEQPEIHLHPFAQRKLAIVLRNAVKRGVVAVVETHSALLLREVQTLIATNRLGKEEVALHWLHRGDQGETTVRTADLDDKGAYGDWPEDFDKTELDAEQLYLDAVEARQGGE
ncbi:MAG: AAA family ATPase [Chloroflexi bacterium]|nr:AAA family ATPase [Chloroflexota bacterium]